MTERYDVFISHSSHDNEFCIKLYEALLKEGLNVFMDIYRIDVGMHISKTIDIALNKSDKILAVISSEYLNSKWCEAELYSHLYEDPLNINRTIIPVLLGNCKLPSLMKSFKYLDARKLELNQVVLSIKYQVTKVYQSSDTKSVTLYKLDIAQKGQLKIMKLLIKERWKIPAKPKDFVTRENDELKIRNKFIKSKETRCIVSLIGKPG